MAAPDRCRSPSFGAAKEIHAPAVSSSMRERLGGGSRLPALRDAGFRNVMVLAGGLGVDRSRASRGAAAVTGQAVRAITVERLGLLLAGRPAEASRRRSRNRSSSRTTPFACRCSSSPVSASGEHVGLDPELGIVLEADPLHAGRARGAGPGAAQLAPCPRA